MPQALDLAAALKRTPAPPARQSKSSEPAEKFDNVLDRKSRVADRSESQHETEQAEQSKPAAKTQKKQKADEAPVEETDPTDESSETESEAPPVEAETESGTSDDDESRDAPLLLDDKDVGEDKEAAAGAFDGETMQALLPGAGTAQDAEAIANGDGADAEVTELPGVQSTQAKSTQPTAVPVQQALTEDSSESGEPQLGAALKIPQEAVTDADADAASLVTATKADPMAPLAGDDAEADLTQTIQAPVTTKTSGPQPTAPVQPPQAPAAPEQHFADNNVDRIVSNVKTELLPNGGTMKMRLDPGNLGQLNIEVTVDDGVLTASFQTSNEEATRLLSHNIQNLKTTLETAGVVVDRIQVKQASPSEQSSSSNSDQRDQQQQNPQDHPARQEQQRREMLQKMWAKLALGDEPLDLVA